MGAGGSIESFTDATTSDLTGADVATPRGISAKTEVVRLRTVLMNQGLATMQFMLALETLGLSSCPINWPDVEALERQMEVELNLERFQRPIMLLAIGYADPNGGVAYSVKKPVESTLHI